MLRYLVAITLLHVWISCALATRALGQDTPKTRVITYSAPLSGYLSNSHFIISEAETLMVDAQLNPLFASQAETFLNQHGAHLSKILITHPHIDHYYGLEHFARKSIGLTLLAGPRTITAIKGTMKQWSKRAAISPNVFKFQVLGESSGVITIGSRTLRYRTYVDRETIENTVLYDPANGNLFTGDLASNRTQI